MHLLKVEQFRKNGLIVFKVLHAMKNKRRDKYGDLTLKIDFSKTYDRVD